MRKLRAREINYILFINTQNSLFQFLQSNNLIISSGGGSGGRELGKKHQFDEFYKPLFCFPKQPLWGHFTAILAFPDTQEEELGRFRYLDSLPH